MRSGSPSLGRFSLIALAALLSVGSARAAGDRALGA